MFIFYIEEYIERKENEEMFAGDVIYFFCISFDFIPEISIVDVTSVIDFRTQFYWSPQKMEEKKMDSLKNFDWTQKPFS